MRFDSRSFLESTQDSAPFAVVILNQPLPLFWRKVVASARFVICCDGGANHLFDTLPAEERTKVLPNVVVGDFDGIREDVKAYYSEQGCLVKHVESQDNTDFEKAMEVLVEHEKASGTKHFVVALGAFGGRIDHNFANIQIPFRFPSHVIYLLADGNMGFLLHANEDHHISHNQKFEGIKCGLVPIGEPAITTHTTGLRWNLDGQEMRFGQLISTNNEVAESSITVRSSGTLFFSVELHHPPSL